MSRAPLFSFLAVAFGFSWLVALVVFIIEPDPLARMGLLVLFMFGPALGALVAQRLAKEQVLRPLGARDIRWNRWWLVAWLAPVVVAVAAGLVALLLPGVELSLDGSGFADRLMASMPADQLAEAQAEIAQIPPIALIGMMLLQALIAAVSINAIAAFGEELGWRGFLHRRWAALGFWRRALLVGVVWGAWHAPIILQGHNYPEHRVLGVAMMIVFCVLLAAPFELVRERAGSVIAASVMHGSVNASAGFAIVFLKGGSDLTVGVTGLAGFLVLAIANVAVHVVRRGSS